MKGDRQRDTVDVEPAFSLSVVVPVFNERYLVAESIRRVLSASIPGISALEIVVVDDGSTDESTREKLAAYKKPRTRVIRTSNQGLSAARNNGIREAEGTIILPLDADDGDLRPDRPHPDPVHPQPVHSSIHSIWDRCRWITSRCSRAS